MPDYRRNYVPGGTFFFTLVTCWRRPILTTSLARSCLRAALETQRAKRPFTIVAFVLLPDHLHTVWTLPENDHQYPVRWQGIKELFTRAYLRGGGLDQNHAADDENGLCGSNDIGNIPVSTKRTWSGAWITSTGTRSSTDSRHGSQNGHGRRSIVT